MDIIAIPTTNETYLANTGTIIYCQFYTSKTIVVLQNSETIESVMDMLYFEHRLNNYTFFKPNNYQIINTNFIDKILTSTPVNIILKNQVKIIVENNRAATLFRLIENM